MRYAAEYYFTVLPTDMHCTETVHLYTLHAMVSLNNMQYHALYSRTLLYSASHRYAMRNYTAEYHCSALV